MSQPLPVEQTEHAGGEVSTILSDKVMIPISCDHCGRTTDVSLDTLKRQRMVVCEHCDQVHTVSDTELRLMRMMLARAGYHFAM